MSQDEVWRSIPGQALPTLYLGATVEVLELLVDLGPGCSFQAPVSREGGGHEGWCYTRS